MYKDYFELERDPFRITPDIQSFFTGGDRGAILRALIYAISNGDAIVKLIGEVGSGKTMLCRMLEQYLPESVDIAYISNPRLTPDNILQTIAFELDLPLSNHECNNRVLMLGALQQYLVTAHAEGRQVIVLVEEAQSIPIETLEEIRLLSNLETSHHKLLQIVLFGQPELDNILQTKSIRQISERIANSFYLQPLSIEDVFDYIQFRLHAAGYRGSNILSRAAIKSIFRHSRGLLRRINILTDKALLAAYQDKSTIVQKNHVKRAVEEFPTSRPSMVTAPMVYAALFSLLVTVSIGLLSRQVPVQKHIPDFNQLPATQAGYSTQNTMPRKMAKLTLASKDIQPPALIEEKHAPNPPYNLHHKLTRSQQWLTNADRNHFTIQVLLTNADIKDEFLKILNKNSLSIAADKLYFIRTNIRGNPMLKVLYGEYTNFAAANKALLALPAALRQYQPYIRNIGTMESSAVSIKATNREL